MSDDCVDEDKVHRICQEKIDQAKRDAKSDREKLQATADGNGVEINGLRLEVAVNNRKLTEIYGNGSGRKGILDRMEDKQAADHDKLAGDLSELKDMVLDEVKKQTSFRHEVRGMFETASLTATVRDNSNKSWVRWIKWVVGGLAIVVWEIIKIKWLKDFK